MGECWLPSMAMQFSFKTWQRWSALQHQWLMPSPLTQHWPFDGQQMLSMSSPQQVSVTLQYFECTWPQQ